MRTQDFGKRWHKSQLDAVDDEIARQAFLCGLKLLDPGVIERVISGDATVCARNKAKAFRQLRALVKMHYALADDSLRDLGAEESASILNTIRERLRKRYELGGGR
jgi:hypothetical protein